MVIALKHETRKTPYTSSSREDMQRSVSEWQASIEPVSDTYRKACGVPVASVRTLTIAICEYDEAKKVTLSSNSS